MRKPPYPLSVHLGVAASNEYDAHKYSLSFAPSFNKEGITKIIHGMKIYMEHPFVQHELPCDTIWSDGATKIIRPYPHNKIKYKTKYPFLLIPSLINKSNILDISEEKSMLRWFNNNGIETYLLDWGNLKGGIEKDFNINDVIENKLCVAVREVSKIEGKPIDLLGYCMGGTMMVAAYGLVSSHIRSMTLLASPWDFSVGASSFARNVRVWSPYVLPVVKDKGFLPSQWVQALFASLDPNGSAQKFSKFASMDQDSSEAKLFISVEDWLNNGVDLPKNIAKQCIEEWFIDNKPFKGEWSIAGANLNLEEIDTDVLIIASKSDKLVPYKSAINIQKNLCSASINIIELDCGHIGLIVGRNAVRDVYLPILNWLINK